ncbi:MAG: S8 family serine peptidase [Bdellovibrionaceae bacterium]|nr:S8 family serine peptidase [Pseudobdellovibrionaceae bacterium]
MRFSFVLVSMLASLFVGTVRAQSARFEMMVYLKSQPNFTRMGLVVERTQRMRAMYVDLVTNAQRTQSPLWQVLQQRGYQYQSFYINNSILVRNADTQLANELQRHPSVLKVTYNTPFRMKPIGVLRDQPTPPAVNGVEQSLTVVKADKVWAMNVGGQGIVVAGQDTGVQWNHPALIRQYRGNTGRAVVHDYNWHDAIKKQTAAGASNRCGYDLKTPCDDNGHGTHTIATVAGSDGKSNHVGVAPAARWMACRNMDAGVGTVSTYTECFEFFFAPYPYGGNPQKDGKPEYAPHVMNNSWGCPKEEGCQGDEFADVLKVMQTAGIMVVASAGNEGPGCASIGAPPANHTELTFSVGATNNAMKIAGFSSRGPSALDKGVGPDIVAPGVNIRSAMPGGGYGSMSGTSMAGPHMVGVVALMWSANKNYVGRVAETANVLRRTAIPLTSNENCGGVAGSTIPNNTYGYGMVDALSAVQTVLKSR